MGSGSGCVRGFFEEFIKSKNIDLEWKLLWYLFRSEGLKFLV